MDPNATNPNNVPPVGDTPPAPQPLDTTPAPAPAAPAAPEAPVAPEAPAPVEPAAPTTPVAPEAPVAPVTPPAPAAPNLFAAAGTPEAPAAPQAPGFAPTPAPQAPGSKNKIVLIAAIVGGAVLLAIIGVVAYFMLTSVSKQDYQEATRQYNKVSVASAGLTGDVSSVSYSISGDDDAEFNEAVKEAEDSIAEIKTENEALSKMKAVRVGEGAKLYGPFNDKVKAYLVYATELINSVKNLRPAMATCGKISDATDTAGRVAALKACSSELQGVTDIPNAEMKTFISTIGTSYGEYATIYEKSAALTNPFGSQYEQYKALRDQMSAVQKKISEASSTLSDSLEKRDDEMSVKDSAKALGDFLTEKQKS
ncbi:hypothetical protein BGO17_03755 [Candidatus Saccharibacteria bacterium 49-20]|nr:MAG: hypothetical protein BGO17_03755 [Candidatus Saccharibacteria bacterium 49-20]